ncbi:MAG: hypothetical protein Q9168_006905, partial [Polycauliona sp. 1 TL-2023]
AGLKTISDPFIFHHTDMRSFWTFYDYTGHLDYNAATTAAREAYNEAIYGHHDFDDPIGHGTTTRIWNGVHGSPEVVDFVLIARPGMTWRMLAEGITGAQMLVYQKKEFKFVVFDGDSAEVGEGLVWSRRPVPRSEEGNGNETAGDVASPAALAARMANVTEVRLTASGLNIAIRAPYTYHRNGMVTTWEFFGFQKMLHPNTCQRTWARAWLDCMEKSGHGQFDALIGSEVLHWSVRHGAEGEWIDLVIHPEENMTWRMLNEGLSGGVYLCSVLSRETQFAVFIEGVEGQLGVGQIKVGRDQVSSS